MKKSVFILSLLSGTAFMFPGINIASGTPTHTHTQTPELKPASLANMDKAFKLASVCFLGVGDCTPEIDYKADDDMTVDTAKQCQNEGFIRNNCNSVQVPDGFCPYNSGYIKGCKCKPGLITCTSPKFGVGESCNGQYASCQCPATVSLTNPQDRCTQYCDGNCIAKTCTAYNNESGCSYGTQSCSNGCGGTRSCCRPCYPYSSESGCSYGTYTCGDGCGGSRTCCSSCSPYSNESGCSYGTYSCSNGCGGFRKCCAAKPANPWRYKQYPSSGNSFCGADSGKYWAVCYGETYCENGNTKNYICTLSYAFGRNFTPQGWGGTGYDTPAECQAAGNRSCSSLVSSSDKGECSNGTTNCHY